MQDPSGYASSLAFVAKYVLARPIAHATIFAAVIAAVTCSVGAQYGIKVLVDTLSGGLDPSGAWWGFTLLASLIAADNLLWRLASWIANSAFVGVTGDLRRDLFRHLTGHAPSYFADRLPGTLTSRITATSNAVYTLENMFVWNVMPPCMATFVAIAFLASVSITMAGVLSGLAAALVFMMFRLAAAGKPLHHEFADRAAAVDGEMVNVIGNMPLVALFAGRPRAPAFRRHHRPGNGARRRSLIYLEKLRTLARLRDRVVDHRAAGLGNPALGEWRCDGWRCGADLHPGTFHFTCDAGFGGRAR